MSSSFDLAALGLPGKLVQGKEMVDSASALANKAVVGLYFSAHWCPPCRGFTPHLAEKYKELLDAGKPFEIVFVSSDRDEAAFDEYFAEMPWLALPYAERALKEKLSAKFKVSGIPTLVLLDGTGALITTKGRSKIDNVEAFPWPKKSLKDLLGGELVGPGGAKVATDTATENKVLGLYFSAHWCPPCRGFTPQLATNYKALKAAGKNIEIVFVSSDKDQAAFDEYFGEMPWLALPFDKRAEKAELSDMFDVSGIPSLIFIGEDGKTITTSGRGKVAAKTFLEDFPYHPKPVNDLSEDLEGINEYPALIVFMEALDDDAQDEACSDLEAPAAAEMARGDDDRIVVFTAKGGGPVDKLRAMVGKNGTPGSNAEMVIISVQAGGFYVPVGEATFSTDSVNAFLAAFRAGELTKTPFK